MPARMNVRLGSEDDALIRKFAPQFGLTLSQLGGLAIHAGLKAILRAVSPEDAISPAKYAEMIKAVQDLELVDVDVKKKNSK
jgi:hypothetical protein